MEEIWKDIIGYEGLYQVSNYGNVKSLGNDKKRKEKILKPRTMPNGYLRVALYINGKVKHFLIHRLVALHFIPNDDLSKTYINHKDENKENNNVNNLEFSTPKENSNYGKRNERISKANINGKTAKQVNQYDLTGNFIRSFQSTREIQRQFGFRQSLISACCRSKPHCNTAYGFLWKYA